MSGGALDDDIIAVIGEEAFLALAEAVGGAQLWLKASYGTDDLVTRAIGAEKAAQLAEYFHGYRLTLPVLRTRRRLILRLAAQGHSGDEIARRLKVSRSSVYNALAKAREAADGARQHELFSARG